MNSARAGLLAIWIVGLIVVPLFLLGQTVRVTTTPGVKVVVEQAPEPPPLPGIANPTFTNGTAAVTNRTEVSSPPRFRCVSVQLKLIGAPVMDGRGLPTGQWQTERRYVATLEPVLIGGTNRVYGRYREKTVDLVTAEESLFRDGGIYDLVPVQ